MEKRLGYRPAIQPHDEIIYETEAPVEDDDDLAIRLHYVIGHCPRERGAELERVAERYGLKRRKKGDFNYGRVMIGVDPGIADEVDRMLMGLYNSQGIAAIKSIPKASGGKYK